LRLSKAEAEDPLEAERVRADAYVHLRRQFVQRLRRWARHSGRAFPWRTADDPFRILVAEVLLQRSRGSTVASVYERLFENWPTANDLARAETADIEAVIRPLGLTSRSRTIRSLAEHVVQEGMPTTVAGLATLPGVGRYAAGATAATVFGVRAPVVDSVSARVYRRVFGLNAIRDNVVDEDLWRLVDETSPQREVGRWNWAVLDLAATVCLPTRPRCEACPLLPICKFASSRSEERGSQKSASQHRVTRV
jgi:A/G-specific adenine glycosylase